jgi:FkbM family methyltransferase
MNHDSPSKTERKSKITPGTDRVSVPGATSSAGDKSASERNGDGLAIGVALPILRGALRGNWWYPAAGGKVFRVLLGTYERAQTDRFLESVAPGAVVLDIGAATGYYTLLASQLAGPKGRVFAFEPWPRNRRFLTAHIEGNRRTNVTVFDAAVGASDGNIGFSAGTGTGTGRIAEDGRLVVPLRAVDSLVREHRLKPTHLKIDVEGAELDVLRGAAATIKLAQPVIFLSTHGPKEHRTCCEFLANLGYHLSPMGVGPLEECEEVYCEPSRVANVRAA